MRILKNTLPFIVSIAVCAGMTACGSQEKKADSVKTRPFPMPNVPAMVDAADRLPYIAEHFWDEYTSKDKRFPDKDTVIINGVAKEELEQAAANYIMLLEQLPLSSVDNAVGRMADKMIAFEEADSSSRLFESLSALICRYMYDPNSPVRDEDLYTPFAARMSVCNLIPQEKRDAFADEARRSSLNRRGTRAADFSFSDRNGRIFSLYGIKSDLTILFFSNPGCTACKEIIETLDNSAEVTDMIGSGELAVLNIYIDEELEEWYKYMPIYPEKWYNGYDHNFIIRGDELYDVRAIPSLYLLDRDKTVLLKDVPTERLMAFLMERCTQE